MNPLSVSAVPFIFGGQCGDADDDDDDEGADPRRTITRAERRAQCVCNVCRVYIVVTLGME